MFDLVLDSTWAGPLLWAAIYISDHSFTIACARLHRAQNKSVIEGSFEITPFFQSDVNALRLFSPRFCLVLIASTGYLFFVRWMTGQSPELRDLYAFVLGMMFLGEAAVHMRHLRNWFMLSKALPLIQGRIEYPRGVMLKMSAFEILTFSGLYLALFFVTGSVFLLGGALACCVLSVKHYRLARRHASMLLKAA